MTRAERVTMIARDRADLSVRRQCALLGLARSGVYREPAAPDAEELALMRWIDIDEGKSVSTYRGPGSPSLSPAPRIVSRSVSPTS